MHQQLYLYSYLYANVFLLPPYDSHLTPDTGECPICIQVKDTQVWS